MLESFTLSCKNLTDDNTWTIIVSKLVSFMLVSKLSDASKVLKFRCWWKPIFIKASRVIDVTAPLQKIYFKRCGLKTIILFAEKSHKFIVWNRMQMLLPTRKKWRWGFLFNNNVINSVKSNKINFTLKDRKLKALLCSVHHLMLLIFNALLG